MILEAEQIPIDLRGYEFNVVMLDLDCMVGESILKNADDSYTILLNSRWSSNMQRYCLLHAFDHVRHNDFEKESVQEIEYEAHRRGEL